MTTSHPVASPSPDHLSFVANDRAAAKRDAALLVLRAAVAAPLFFHGTQKLLGWFGGTGLDGFAAHLERLGVPFALPSAALAAVAEVLGAGILTSGRGFRLLLPTLFTMIVATLTSIPNGFDVQRSGFEFPLLVSAALVALALLGPGSIVAKRPLTQSEGT